MSKFSWIHLAVTTLIVVGCIVEVASATSWWLLVAVAVLCSVGAGAGALVGLRLRAKRAKSPP